jgi:hypothetical protein
MSPSTSPSVSFPLLLSVSFPQWVSLSVLSSMSPLCNLPRFVSPSLFSAPSLHRSGSPPRLCITLCLPLSVHTPKCLCYLISLPLNFPFYLSLLFFSFCLMPFLSPSTFGLLSLPSAASFCLLSSVFSPLAIFLRLSAYVPLSVYLLPLYCSLRLSLVIIPVSRPFSSLYLLPIIIGSLSLSLSSDSPTLSLDFCLFSLSQPSVSRLCLPLSFP